MRFAIGSESERKIKIARKVIAELFGSDDFDILGHATVSGVPETPYDRQTFDGAKNRALNTKENFVDFDYSIGLESGLVDRYGHMYEEAWAVVINKDGEEFFGYSSGLKVPDFIISEMDRLNMEHCDVMTIIERDHGNLPNDTWGTYSGGAILRETSLEEALRNALIQVTAPDKSFYKKK